jgi:8-oxo-dGTP diphosphatase
MQLSFAAMSETPTTQHPMPFCRIELAVLAPQGGRLALLLSKRDAVPDRGKWALPGGVVKIEEDADLDDAAARVAKERLGHLPNGLQPLRAVGGRGRDTRGAARGWAISLVYRALLGSPPDVTAGKRVQELRWVDVTEFGSLGFWAFDHRQLAQEAVATTRRDIEDFRFPPGYLPSKFTLTELQRACEAALGQPLEKSNFRRKLRDRDVVEAVEGEFQTGAFRPAALYRLKAQ